MLVCPHDPLECMQVFYQGHAFCVTNFNELTTVDDVIHVLVEAFLDNDGSAQKEYCLFVEHSPYSYPLKRMEIVQKILQRCSLSHIPLKFLFQRPSSLTSRFAQRKQLRQISSPPSKLTDPYEQLRRQEQLIQRQEELIERLRRIHNENRFVDEQRGRRDTSVQSNYHFRVTATLDDQRPSRREEYYPIGKHDTSNTTSRCPSRFRSASAEKHQTPLSNVSDVKSICRSTSNQRISTVDRLTSIAQRRHSVYISGDEHLTNRGTIDPFLRSLVSMNRQTPLATHQRLETLV